MIVYNMKYWKGQETEIIYYINISGHRFKKLRTYTKSRCIQIAYMFSSVKTATKRLFTN